jgi:hypothetical protein
MRNPLDRGNSPGRAREAYQRPGSFKLGHKKLGGRKKGTPNAISADLKKALLQAAHRVGSDGNGKDGLGGYIAWLRTRDPDFVYVFLVGRILDYEEYLNTIEGNSPPATNELDEGVQGSIDGTKSAGRTKEFKSFEWLRGGADAQASLVQDLMRMAVEQPKIFTRMFAAAWLTPPKDWRRRFHSSTRSGDAGAIHQ